MNHTKQKWNDENKSWECGSCGQSNWYQINFSQEPVLVDVDFYVTQDLDVRQEIPEPSSLFQNLNKKIVCGYCHLVMDMNQDDDDKY